MENKVYGGRRALSEAGMRFFCTCATAVGVVNLPLLGDRFAAGLYQKQNQAICNICMIINYLTTAQKFQTLN